MMFRFTQVIGEQAEFSERVQSGLQFIVQLADAMNVYM